MAKNNRANPPLSFKFNAHAAAAFALTFAVIYTYAYMYNRAFGLSFLTALVLVPLGSFLTTLAAAGKTEFKISVNKHEFIKGENAEITLLISNKSLLPLPFCFVSFDECFGFCDFGQNEYTVSVTPKKTAVIKKNLRAAVWGAYKIAPARVWARDYLGFINVSFGARDELCQTVSVCPAVYEPQKNDLALYICGEIMADDKNDDQDESDKTSFLSQPGYTYRPYAPPDPLNRVNWKLLAKLDKLMVREDEYIKNENPVLVIDRAGAVSNEPDGADKKNAALFNERVIEAALAHLTSLLKEAVFCDVYYYRDCAWRRVHVESEEHVYALSFELAHFSFKTPQLCPNRLPENLQESGALMFFTPNPFDAQALFEAAGARRKTTLVCPDELAVLTDGIWAVNKSYDFYAV